MYYIVLIGLIMIFGFLQQIQKLRRLTIPKIAYDKYKLNEHDVVKVFIITGDDITGFDEGLTESDILAKAFSVEFKSIK